MTTARKGTRDRKACRKRSPKRQPKLVSGTAAGPHLNYVLLGVSITTSNHPSLVLAFVFAIIKCLFQTSRNSEAVLTHTPSISSEVH